MREGRGGLGYACAVKDLVAPASSAGCYAVPASPRPAGRSWGPASRCRPPGGPPGAAPRRPPRRKGRRRRGGTCKQQRPTARSCGQNFCTGPTKTQGADGNQARTCIKTGRAPARTEAGGPARATFKKQQPACAPVPAGARHLQVARRGRMGVGIVSVIVVSRVRPVRRRRGHGMVDVDVLPVDLAGRAGPSAVHRAVVVVWHGAEQRAA